MNAMPRWCLWLLIAATALVLGGCADGSPPLATSPIPGTETTHPTTAISPTQNSLLNGRELAFVSTEGALWLLDDRGRKSKVFAPANGFVYYPEWSPDGKNIAFTEISYDRRPPTFVSLADALSVVVVDISGHEIARVARATMPHWSPDSEALSILLEPNAQDVAFFGIPSIINVASSAVRQILPSLQTLDSPRWSPDGEDLAYATFDGGLFIVNATGDPAPQLLASGESYTKFYLGPVWAEDGSILAFESDRTARVDSGGRDSYVVVSPKRGVVNRVPDSHPSKCGRSFGFREVQAFWLPDGSLAAWPVECQTPPGIWIKSMTDDAYERFIDVSAVSQSIRGIDVSQDAEFILFSDAGPVPKWDPPLVSSENAARFNVYLVHLADGTASVLLPRTMEAVWRP